VETRCAPDRGRAFRAGPGRLLQRGAGPIPGLQRQLPGEGRNMPPQRQPRSCTGCAEYAGIPGKSSSPRWRCVPGPVPPLRLRTGPGARFDHVTHGVIAAAAVRRKRCASIPTDRECRGHRRHGEQRAESNRTENCRTGKACRPTPGPPACRPPSRHAGYYRSAEMFEGAKGWMHVVSGPFEIDWEGENLERVNRTILKKYNAEIHSQSAIEE